MTNVKGLWIVLLSLYLSVACSEKSGETMDTVFNPNKPYEINGPLTPEEQLQVFSVCIKEVDHAPIISAESNAKFRAVRQREASPYFKNEQEQKAITEGYAELAAEGNWMAAYNLAIRHMNGKGTIGSYSSAVDVLEPMAQANIPIGIYGMALLLRDGNGVKKDPTLASQYMWRAAELGSPLAQYYLGMAAYGRYESILAKSFLRCAAAQGNKNAAYELASIIKIGEQNYPLAAKYYLLAASQGHELGFMGLQVFFDGSDEDERKGFDKNPEFIVCIKKYKKQLGDDPSAKFPEMLTECKIPLHPIMGDGSQYPDLEDRYQDFLERLKAGNYDPEWERAKARERTKGLQDSYWSNRKSASIEPIEYKTIPLEGIDQWTMEQVQSGEYFVKRDRTWIYVKDGAEVPSRISGYLESVLNIHYVNVLEVEAFHEETDGQFKAMLRTMLG